jgi:biotin transport system ATP-binding protein
MIEIENLTHRYDPSQPSALDGITLHLREGEYVALIGPNGCGKTTLARHLNGLILPASGRVSVDGMETRDRRRIAEIRRRVGMIFQNPENQIVGVTVEEDVAFGPGNLRLPPAEIRTLVDRALALVGLTSYESRQPHTLSGGEKQLLALAGILSMTPRYVILDEPTASLDPVSREKVLSIVASLNKTGIGIIHITHSMEDVTSADRVVVMDKGRIAADGTPSDVFRRVGWLKSLGLAPPRITELMWRLCGEGEESGPAVFTIEEALGRIIARAAAPTRGPTGFLRRGPTP